MALDQVQTTIHQESAALMTLMAPPLVPKRALMAPPLVPKRALMAPPLMPCSIRRRYDGASDVPSSEPTSQVRLELGYASGREIVSSRCATSSGERRGELSQLLDAAHERQL
jgi:hypothetical protein